MGTIGRKIANARESMGLNQSELARKLKVTPQSVQAWESDKNVPRPQKLKAICALLGIAIGNLMGDENDGQENAQQARNLTLLASPRSQSALAKIAEAADSGRLTEDDVLLLEKIATHLEAKKQIQPSFVEVPPELKALAEATINMAQSGENPDDLLKMLEHGLKKQQPTEDIKKNDVSKKKSHRA